MGAFWFCLKYDDWRPDEWVQIVGQAGNLGDGVLHRLQSKTGEAKRLEIQSLEWGLLGRACSIMQQGPVRIRTYTAMGELDHEERKPGLISDCRYTELGSWNHVEAKPRTWQEAMEFEKECVNDEADKRGQDD